MDVDELRNAFILSNSITKRIEDFRRRRLTKIKTNQTPIPINSVSKVAIHLIPIISFNSGFNIDIQSVARDYLNFKPPLGGAWDGQFNLNGFMTYSNEESYTLIFNSGIIEAVNTTITSKDVQGVKGIPGILFEKMLLECVSEYVTIQHNLGITFPIFLFVTFSGMKDKDLFSNRSVWGPKIPNLEDTMDLSESKIESYDPDSIDVTVRSTIDSLYNAYGYHGSSSYNKEGRWKSK